MASFVKHLTDLRFTVERSEELVARVGQELELRLGGLRVAPRPLLPLERLGLLDAPAAVSRLDEHRQRRDLRPGKLAA